MCAGKSVIGWQMLQTIPVKFHRFFPFAKHHAKYKATYSILKYANNIHHNVTYIKTYVHVNAASEENLGCLRLHAISVHNMHKTAAMYK